MNAGKDFLKGNPKNYVTDEQIKNIVEIYNTKKEIDNFSIFANKDEVIKKDYNISPSRYINTDVAVEYLPIKDVLVELAEVEMRASEADKNLQEVLKKLEF